ncbi:MAG: ABC transporter permease [Gemmiger sp.]
MTAIFKREFKSCFTGMIGWVIAAVSLFFLGLYFTNRNLLYASSDFASVLYTMTMILLFLLPAISMRSFAEERKNKTDQLLLTSPVSIPAIVAGKFLAELAVFALPLAAAVVMPLLLQAFGTVSLVAAYSALLGYLLLGGACLAVGTWISALTENQILAYLATFGALLVAYLMNGIQTMFTTGNLLAFIVFMIVLLVASVLVGVICKRLAAGAIVFCAGAVVLFVLFQLRPAWLLTAFNAVLSALALFEPFKDIVGGMFSIPAIVYYLSVMGLFLFLTGQALARRRWN